MLSGGSPASVRFELRSRVSPSSVSFTAAVAEAQAHATQSCRSQWSFAGKGHDDSVEPRPFSGALATGSLLAAAGLSDESSSSSHARHTRDRHTDFDIPNSGQATRSRDLLSDRRTAHPNVANDHDWESDRLEARAQLRQRNFGTLRSSWLVKIVLVFGGPGSGQRFRLPGCGKNELKSYVLFGSCKPW